MQILQLQTLAPGENPSLSEEAIQRVLANPVAQREIEEMYGAYFSWEEHWRGLPIQAFDKITLEEKVSLWYSTILDSDLGQYLRKQEPTSLLEKIRLSLWYYGGLDDWNHLVGAYLKVCSFEFGEPHFTTTIDYPWALQGYGTGHHRQRWLDGSLAFHLDYKGEHAAILGFSISREGLLIQQAQATPEARQPLDVQASGPSPRCDGGQTRGSLRRSCLDCGRYFSRRVP